jgi:hypothetical protein
MDIREARDEIRKTLRQGIDSALDWLQREGERTRLCCDPVSAENNLVTMYLWNTCADAMTVLGGWCHLLDGKTLFFGTSGEIALPSNWQLLHRRVADHYDHKTGRIVPLDALSAWLNDPEDRYFHQRDFAWLREAYQAFIAHGDIRLSLPGIQGWIYCKHGAVVEVATLHKALLLLANPHTTVVHMLPDTVRRPPTHPWLLYEYAVLTPRTR